MIKKKKTLQKIGIKEQTLTDLNIIKAMYDKPTGNQRILN